MTARCPSCGTRNRLQPAKLHLAAHCGKCKAAVSPLDHPHEFDSLEEFDQVIASASLPVLVDFWAGWCGPCVMVRPEFDRLAGLVAGRVLLAKVDTEALPEVAARFHIAGIPAFVLFRDGREATRASGAMPAEGIARATGIALAAG